MIALANEAFGSAVEEILAQFLLQNKPELTIIVGKNKNKKGILGPLLKECVSIPAPHLCS